MPDQLDHDQLDHDQLDPKEILRRARLKLLDAGWVQNVFATDGAGRECGPEDSLALNFCALGACHAITDLLPNAPSSSVQQSSWQARCLLMAAARRHGCQGVADFNDRAGRTKEEVVRLFDEALALSPSEMDADG